MADRQAMAAVPLAYVQYRCCRTLLPLATPSFRWLAGHAFAHVRLVVDKTWLIVRTSFDRFL